MTFKINKIVNELSGSSNRLDTSDRKRAAQQKNRVLDAAARNRRTRQQLAQLERDNFHDDPHANLVMHKKAPKFDDSIVEKASGSSRKSTGHTARIRTVPWQVMVDEDVRLNPYVNYSTALAPPPNAVRVLREPLPIVHRPVFSCDSKQPSTHDQTTATLSTSAVIASGEPTEVEGPVVEKRKKRQLETIDKSEAKKGQLRTLLQLPVRHFCCVCGFQAPYTCVVCGMRYCCTSCLGTHKDTRCLKWTA